jgi:outer membrane receptor protein involved in Fe transport
MAYTARWDSTDQIPLRAVRSGLIGRYGTVDPTDGGKTQRYSLSIDHQRVRDDGAFRFNAYAIQSELDLWSNFTYQLENPIDLNPAGINGDQFRQSEQRKVFGMAISRTWDSALSGRAMINTLGLQLRHDRLDPVGLYSTVARSTVATVQQSRVRQTSVSLYGENSVQWSPWLRSVAGLRADHFDFDVDSSIPQNSGDARDDMLSPKLSLIFGPWQRTEYFVNYGHGFHSNDAAAPRRASPRRAGCRRRRSTRWCAPGAANSVCARKSLPGLQSSLPCGC